MKRILLLIVLGLLLAGCGLSGAAEDNLSNAASMGWDEGVAAVFAEVTVDSVKCDVHPWMNSFKAQAICRLDVEKEDALKLGATGPVTLYLGGMLTVSDDKFTFDNDKPFTGEGKGQMRIAGPYGEGAITQSLQNVHELPLVSLTAQIDGLRVPVEITGVASMESTQEMSILTNNENVVDEFRVLECAGRVIPNSSRASIIMIGEGTAGQKIVGGGIIETNILSGGNDSPMIIGCEPEKDAGVVYEIEVKDFNAFALNYEEIKWTFLNFEEIKVTLKMEDGGSIAEKSATISGFVIGDGGIAD